MSNDKINADIGDNASNTNVGKNIQNVTTGDVNAPLTINQTINDGPQPRSITVVAANILIDELRKYPPETYKIVSTAGNLEAEDLAIVLMKILEEAGWETESRAIFMSAPPVRGIRIQVPEAKRTNYSLVYLLNWLNGIGLVTTGNKSDNMTVPYIEIGVNPHN